MPRTGTDRRLRRRRRPAPLSRSWSRRRRCPATPPGPASRAWLGEQVGDASPVRQGRVDPPGRLGEPFRGGGRGQPFDPGAVMPQVAGDPRAQQQRGLRDGAGRRERHVGEPLPGADQRHAFGAPLQAEAGEPLDVLGEPGRAELAAQFAVHVGVVDDRMLQDEPPGPARVPATLRLEALGRRCSAGQAAAGAVKQLGDRVQVLKHPARRVDGTDHLAVDVVQRLGALRVVDPLDGRAVGHPQRPARLQPGDRVHERVPVGFAAGVHAHAVNAPGVGGDRVGQLAECDLGARAAQRGQGQYQVGVAAAVERPPRPGDRRAGAVQRVLRPAQPDGVAAAQERVAENLAEVGPQLPGPPAHEGKRRGVRIGRGDQRVAQHQPRCLLVFG